MKVYLDNAATTPLLPEVFEAMAPVLKEQFGNPSSTHSFGRTSKSLIETSRRKVAQYLNAKPAEILFTSGGTEADNTAILTAIRDLGVKRIITSEVEHHAVLHTSQYYKETKNIEIEYVKLNAKGHVDLQELEKMLGKSNEKTLVSLMHANNEIGTLLPLEKVGEICKENKALFHSDTVQTMGHYAFDVQKLNVDFLTCGAHKLHGPKGVGFLYINKNLKLSPVIHGGSQERGMRGGTENIYGIVGLAKAMELAYEELSEHQKYIRSLKDYMIDELQKTFSNSVKFNGDTSQENSLYTVLNVSLPPSEKSDMLLFTLDLKGIACSGGSACSSGSTKGSHVLAAIGADMSRPNVRFSFSRLNNTKEIDYVVETIKNAYQKEIV